MRRACWLTAFLLLALPVPASAQSSPPASDRDAFQQWIHANAKDCCPHDRCFPVIAAPGPRYWSILGFRSAVPMGNERRWPFDRTYGCEYALRPGIIFCLFVPPQEQS